MQTPWRQLPIRFLVPLWLVCLAAAGGSLAGASGLCAVRADDDEGEALDPHAIPEVGRPAGIPFSEANGNFRVEMDADPTAVEVEDPLILTVRVTATAPVYKPPRRLPLDELPAFRRAFHIDDIPDREIGPTQEASLAGLLAGP